MFRMYDKVHQLVNTFGMPDTVGIATPTIVAERIKALKERYPKVDLECHFHNDRGFPNQRDHCSTKRSIIYRYFDLGDG